MASELLKTFQKIESGRKLQIEKARALGHTLSDRASFAELAATIATPQEIPENTVGTVLEDWVPPVEFPDGKKLIRESEDRDGFKPGMYLLIKDNAETITLDAFNTATPTSSTNRTNASGILLSDGTWYNDLTANITHTWDTSKDIIIEDGEFAGTYRWLLCYYDPNKVLLNSYFGFINGYKVVDWVVGYIATSSDMSKATSYSSIALFNRWDSTAQYLLNIEVLDESNITKLYSYINSTTGGLGYYWTNLRSIKFGPVTEIKLSQSHSHQLFYNAKKLRHIDMSNVTTFTNGTRNFLDILNIISCESLVSFKLGATVIVGMRGYYANLKEFIAPKATIWTDDVTKDYQRTFIVPEDCDFQAYLITGMLPINWRTNKGVPVEGGYQALGYTASRNVIPFIKNFPVQKQRKILKKYLVIS